MTLLGTDSTRHRHLLPQKLLRLLPQKPPGLLPQKSPRLLPQQPPSSHSRSPNFPRLQRASRHSPKSPTPTLPPESPSPSQTHHYTPPPRPRLSPRPCVARSRRRILQRPTRSRPSQTQSVFPRR